MVTILRYSSALLLVLAAVLAPNLHTASILAAASLATTTLTIIRERTFSRVLSLRVENLQKRFLLTVLVAELAVLIAVLVGGLDVTTGRNYALLALVSLSTLGLEAELAVLYLTHRKHSSETLHTAIAYATEDAYGLLTVAGLSFMGSVALHIPPALSAVQLLVVTCVARPLLSGRALQAIPHKTDRVWRVFFASIVVYGGYIFFFIRHYIEPRYADSVNPVTWQATTLALVSFIGCQAALLVFNPKAPKVTVYRAGALLVLVLGFMYAPFMHRLSMSAGLAAADWAWVIIGSLCFTSLYLLQRQSSLHGRKAVLELHQTEVEELR